MKKLIIGLILSAAAAAGIITYVAVSNTTAEAKPSVTVPTLTEGRYYMGGKEDSGVYLEVKDGTIALVGDSVPELFEKQQKLDEPELNDKEALKAEVDEKVSDYIKANEYIVSVVGTENVPYAVLISWNKNVKTDDNRYSGYGYFYDGDKTLSLNGFDDFVLIG